MLFQLSIKKVVDFLYGEFKNSYFSFRLGANCKIGTQECTELTFLRNIVKSVLHG